MKIPWRLILKTVLPLLIKLTLWVLTKSERDALIAKGEAAQVRKNLEAANEKIRSALAAGKAAADRPHDADGDGVRDSDGFRRDD